MFLTVLDIILTLVLFMFIAFGFALGFVHTLGALVGVIAGAWVAGTFYGPFASWISPIFLGNQTVAEIVSFIFLFLVVNRLFGIVIWLLNKIFKIISIIPLTKTLNRLLGAFFGLIEGVLVIGLTLSFLAQLDFSEWLNNIIAGSNVAYILMAIALAIAPILPKLFRQIRDLTLL